MATYAYSYSSARPPWRERLRYQLRVLRVMAGVEFKLKYVDSALGYAWSLAKPLAYFGVLWVVFGRYFSAGTPNFALYLLIGIVLYTFVTDAVGLALTSIVTRGSLLRRIAFPPIVIPVAASLTALMTFGVNTFAVVILTAGSRLTPRVEWLFVPLLLVELYVFVLGLALFVSTLFVRLRDVGPLWELIAQLLLFASPVMYPISILPAWAERIVALNPFVQVMQDVRQAMIGGPGLGGILGGDWRRIVPISIAFATLAAGLWLHRREAPRLAEQV